MFLVISSALAQVSPQDPVQVFLTKVEEPVISYKGFQRLEGTWDGGKFGKLSGWIKASIQFSLEKGFSYQIIEQGGSSLIREKALEPFLKGQLNEKDATLSAFTESNYQITYDHNTINGLIILKLNPRRKENRLIDGWLFIHPDGNLAEVTWQAAKNISRMLRDEKMTRFYTHINGVRVPIKMYSTAVFGFHPSESTVEYYYTEINGQQIK